MNVQVNGGKERKDIKGRKKKNKKSLILHKENRKIKYLLNR